jgi:hypothetical protein
MQDTHTKRALNSIRERHAAKARQSAERIQEHAGYILRQLDKGEIPYYYHLVDDAVELERRIAALNEVKDVVGIFDAQDADEEPTP